MHKYIIYIVFTLIALTSCNNNDSETNSNSSANEKLAEKFGLTLFELENGVGPIKSKLQIGEINNSLAEQGRKLFDEKCAQCHKLDERYTGPALRGVTERRTPEYIMNMILNPEEMTKRHPEAKKLLAIHANQMTFQNVTQENARALLEFLRMESSH
ncbi:MAG: cytochrome c [Ignavibacteriales bacterium]|nr:cytochrome c [Ignavibacteriales bacterium]